MYTPCSKSYSNWSKTELIFFAFSLTTKHLRIRLVLLRFGELRKEGFIQVQGNKFTDIFVAVAVAVKDLTIIIFKL